MRQFFKFMFASMLGMVLALILFFFISIAIIGGMVSSIGKQEVSISSNSILEIKFDRPIKERSSKDPFSEIGLNFTEKKSGLNDILKNIEKARDDSRVKGILLNLSSLTAGTATVEAIRRALVDFKTSGKFIYAYGDEYRQSTYYLASVADKVYLHPEGDFDWRGLNAELMFVKGTLAKLEVEPQIIRHGKFKSAVEPFINDKMSPENRLQISTLLNSVWDNYIGKVAASRKVDANAIKEAAAEMKIQTPQDAVEIGLVDKLAYFDEVLSELKKKTGQKESEKIKFVDLKKYNSASIASKKAFSKNKIAVIYAVGDIQGGKGDENTIGSDKISETIRKARMDSSIKAIVLRVNSPGGSALASDVIWREMVLAKKAKPVIVSMGDLAASGGYYIACAADTIVAEANTITGSIGVFGLLFNTQKMFNNKLGITFDTVKTGRFADLGNATRPLSQEEKDIIQRQVERIYDTFITHVSEGRHISKAEVDSMGQGRVWTGVDAKRLGLVDVIGGINTAIEIAAKKAKLDNYRTVALPEQDDVVKKLVEDLSAKASTNVLEDKLGESYQYYQHLTGLLKQQGIVARMPFEVEIY
jgi:protease IV